MGQRIVHVVVAAACAASLSACGGGGGGGSGPSLKQTAYITRPQNCRVPHFSRLVIFGAEHTDYCAYAPNPLQMPSGGCPPHDDGEKVLELNMQLSTWTDPAIPIGPGTYRREYGDLVVIGRIGNGDYTCPSDSDGTGSVTLTSVTDTSGKGTYDVTVGGESYSGTIDAAVCWIGDEVDCTN